MDILNSKHFKTEPELVDWVNEAINVQSVVSIVKDVTNGDWVLFFIEK